MGFIGGYDLHLYCDNKQCPNRYDMPDIAAGCNYREARAFAKARGWYIRNRRAYKPEQGRGFCLCPTCAGEVNDA